MKTTFPKSKTPKTDDQMGVETGPGGPGLPWAPRFCGPGAGWMSRTNTVHTSAAASSSRHANHVLPQNFYGDTSNRNTPSNVLLQTAGRRLKEPLDILRIILICRLGARRMTTWTWLRLQKQEIECI